MGMEKRFMIMRGARPVTLPCRWMQWDGATRLGVHHGSTADHPRRVPPLARIRSDQGWLVQLLDGFLGDADILKIHRSAGIAKNMRSDPRMGVRSQRHAGIAKPIVVVVLNRTVLVVGGIAGVLTGMLTLPVLLMIVMMSGRDLIVMRPGTRTTRVGCQCLVTQSGDDHDDGHPCGKIPHERRQPAILAPRIKPFHDARRGSVAIKLA